MIDKWEIVIGCEIHTQLLTKTKAFCACENRYGGMPDTRVCPVCLGLPGAMPRISKGYVELGAVAGQALNCNIARFTKFDRKHYFYPDLAKGYQITQYDIPLCTDGFVDLPLVHYPKDQQPGGAKCRDKNFKGDDCIIDGKYRRVRVERIHLEEDVGKSLHLQGAHSYIDYNRCGTPLIEIVTKPDMTSPEEAALFMQTVQEILRYVKVTNGNLEEGNMRCDANINLNVWEDGKLYHTPISEIKNLNSFQKIKDACTYEAQRQLKEFQEDRQEFNPGFKVTMGWDDEKGNPGLDRVRFEPPGTRKKRNPNWIRRTNMEELVFATVIDGIVTFVLFLIWQNEREIRGRLLPLCVLTLLHALLVPAMLVSDALHARFFEYILGGIYLFSTPVLLVFIILYSIRLSNRSRMTRLLEISTVIFILNLVIQALCAIFAWGHSQGG